MSGERRGMTFPAHHLVGADLSFTCTNCGGHTSTTPPCIPAKTYPTPEPSEVAETTAGERCPDCGLTGAMHTSAGRSGYNRYCDNAPAEPDAGEVEALAEVIAGIDGGRLADASMRAHDACLRAARAVLASPWLAAHVSAAETKARADERERIAKAIATSVSYGFGLNHDGSDDSHAMAYVEGLKDAHDIARGDAR